MPTFSIIMCSHIAERTAAASAHYKSVFAGHSFELIVITDATSMSEGYNRGFAQSAGDLIIFTHDDIEFLLPNTPNKIYAHLQSHDVIGIAGTRALNSGAWVSAGDPHTFCMLAYPEADDRLLIKACGNGGLVIEQVQAVDGCFIACQRRVATAIAFDQMTFNHFHLYDIDFSYRAALAGYSVAVARDLLPVHASRGDARATWDAQRQRFETKFAGQLSSVPNGPTRAAQARVSRNRLAQFADNGGIEQLLAALR
jgi:hypothetical protein